MARKSNSVIIFFNSECLWDLWAVAMLVFLIWITNVRWTLCPNTESRYLDPHLDTCDCGCETFKTRRLLVAKSDVILPRYNPDYEKFPQFAKAQCGQALWVLVTFWYSEFSDVFCWFAVQVTVSPGVPPASLFHSVAVWQCHVWSDCQELLYYPAYWWHHTLQAFQIRSKRFGVASWMILYW